MFTWLRSLMTWTPDEARERILAGTAPARMRVRGVLNLANCRTLKRLPARLSASAIDVSNCRNLEAIPPHLEASVLLLRRCNIEEIPWLPGVRGSIDASGCRQLRKVGPGIVEELVLSDCTRLRGLPEHLQVKTLILRGCTQLNQLPQSITKTVEVLDVGGCIELATLPQNFERLQMLDIHGCRKLTELPAGMQVRRSMEVANTGLSELPRSLTYVTLRWRGVPVTESIAFAPETITVQDVLTERNAALRSVMLERMGMQRFFAELEPEVLDEDRDAGGVRQLLRVRRRGIEPIVCVQVQCPSTGSRYLLRVPPETYTCQEAVAWTAGYRDPRSYQPVLET